MATKRNIVIDQGSDFVSNVNAKKSDGTAVDLTGYTVRSQMRKSPQSLTSYAFETRVASALEGLVELKLSSLASSQMEAGRYLFDVEIESSAGIVTRILQGIVTLTPEITR